MSISPVSGFLSGLTGIFGADSTRQKSPASIDAARSEMDEIREKGLTEWAREQKMEALKEKLRAEVLSDKRLTEDGVAGLSVEQRSSVEDEIAKLIQQKMEEMMQRSMDDAARTGKTEAVLLDIMV
ncbi:hypothetical protein [Brevundimonas sp.]|jgi:hypothetical protein|uniref:hypothetical protein n=1 Tax=Brevundimonas sp. TaxID=1871086 RepID=UPI0025C3BDF5|nr:hypothetical protein [Brevundimonas sp.]